MNQFAEYLELKRQCKMENIDYEDFVNFRIMKALEEIAYKQPTKEMSQLKSENEYFRDKAIKAELELSKGRSESYNLGYEAASNWYEIHNK